jgi:photosystem II stability/assembly factor-like uncharacterized protein
MKQSLPLILSILLAAIIPASATTPASRQASFEKHLELQESSIFKELEWRSIGPYFGSGRVVAIEAYVSNPGKFLVASATGGLWRTSNNGTTWEQLFETESSLTIGDIAISNQSESLIWVGTGESNSYGLSLAGTGVFKSTDGGLTWANMGLADTYNIAKVLIHPTDPDTVFVAALGHMYTKNQERGVFKTTDGGRSWEKVLYVDAETGAVDLVMHPTDPDTLLAASFPRLYPKPYCGAKSAVYRSTDGGTTWSKAVTGFPQGDSIGRIGLAASISKPGVFYASVDDREPGGPASQCSLSPATTQAQLLSMSDDQLQESLNQCHVPRQFTAELVKWLLVTRQLSASQLGGYCQMYAAYTFKGMQLLKSTNAGKTWSNVKPYGEAHLPGVYGFYGYIFGQIRVDPMNEDTVYLLGIPLMKSVDGGATFKTISEEVTLSGDLKVHVDQHALWINPKNPRHLILGTDGGVNISYDGGVHWLKLLNLPIGQCFTVDYDLQDPYQVYTGLQDVGALVGPSDFATWNREKIWYSLSSQDSGQVRPDTADTSTVYVGTGGSILRVNRQDPGNPTSITPSGSYRFYSMVTPYIVSEHDDGTLYVGANKVLKSSDRGDHWFEISPDLTDQDKASSQPTAAITALAQSQISAQILYAGTQYGKMWVTRQGSDPWTEISSNIPQEMLPTGMRVSHLAASRFKQGRVYVTLTGITSDNLQTCLLASDDYGKTWASLSEGLPGEESANVIVEDLYNPSRLYLGTDLGIYVSLDRGQTWSSLQGQTIANVSVQDIKIHPRTNELMIATYGRGIYLLPVAEILRVITAEQK